MRWLELSRLDSCWRKCPAMRDLGQTSRPGSLGHLLGCAISEAKANPARSILIAAGLGYATGGGLVSPLTARILRVGLRAALRMMAFPLAQAAVPFARGLFWDVMASPEDSTRSGGAGTGNE